MQLSLPQELRQLASPRAAVLGALLSLTLLWVYAPSLVGLSGRWAHDAKYSHGYLVPLFAAYLVWMRRDQVDLTTLSPNWWGLLVLAGGLIFRAIGAYFYYPWITEASIVPLVTGVAMVLGGWTALKWAWPGLLFLLFMLPLPYRVEQFMGGKLQTLATLSSVYVLQTIGLTATYSGNIILIKGVPDPIGVAEACNGLGMLMIFFALTTAVVVVIQRSWIDKAVLLVSAVPIALICNITRIAVTSILYLVAPKELAQRFFHDWAGWMMMPMALGLLWLELKTIDWLLIQPKQRVKMSSPAGRVQGGETSRAIKPVTQPG